MYYKRRIPPLSNPLRKNCGVLKLMGTSEKNGRLFSQTVVSSSQLKSKPLCERVLFFFLRGSGITFWGVVLSKAAPYRALFENIMRHLPQKNKEASI